MDSVFVILLLFACVFECKSLGQEPSDFSHCEPYHRQLVESFDNSHSPELISYYKINCPTTTLVQKMREVGNVLLEEHERIQSSNRLKRMLAKNDFCFEKSHPLYLQLEAWLARAKEGINEFQRITNTSTQGSESPVRYPDLSEADALINEHKTIDH